MGSPEDEKGRRDNEGPQHEVTISRDFALGRYPVTFEEYDHFCVATGRDKPDDRTMGQGTAACDQCQPRGRRSLLRLVEGGD